jgi:glycerol-3-phosphate acyltransferase PlsY
VTAALLGCLGGYLLGALPFSAWIARAHGVDLRQVGSGNYGATNVARALGKGWGALALALDAAKGAAAVCLGDHLGLVGWELLAVGFCGILGHVASVFLGFRGGKGVATSAGVFLALEPVATGMAFMTFVGTVVLTRYVSLGSMLAGFALLSTLVLTRGWEAPATRFALVAWVLMMWRHRANIGRLLRGTESRFGGTSS